MTLVRINWEHWRLGALRLSVSNTVLVFLVIPLGVILVVGALVFAASDRTRRTRRYRPGRPYDFQPIWFLASPEQVAHTAPALTGNQSRQALEASVLEDAAGQRVKPGSTGGASDSW